MQKDSNDGLGGVTTLKLHGEGMFGQCDVRLFLISPQCRVEKRLKMSGSCLVSHLTSREEMESLEGGWLAVRKWWREGGMWWAEGLRRR
jgi:hypothetical protein